MTPTHGAAFDWRGFSPERVAYFSDLHLEFADFELASDLGADMVLIAGDAHTKGRAGAWAARLGLPCALVLGNHDYYGSHLAGAVERARSDALAGPVAVLENQELRLANLRILGCTLWTDYRLLGDAPRAMNFAEGKLRDPYASGMSDHRKIRARGYARARASDFAGAHARSRAFLERALAEPCDVPTLAMTHHAPSSRSLLSGGSDPFDPCYASDLRDLLGAGGAQVWIHGHVHRAADYLSGPTRVLCNPRGYPGEATGFDPRATLLVSDMDSARRAPPG